MKIMKVAQRAQPIGVVFMGYSWAGSNQCCKAVVLDKHVPRIMANLKYPQNKHTKNIAGNSVNIPTCQYWTPDIKKKKCAHPPRSHCPTKGYPFFNGSPRSHPPLHWRTEGSMGMMEQGITGRFLHCLAGMATTLLSTYEQLWNITFF